MCIRYSARKGLVQRYQRSEVTPREGLSTSTVGTYHGQTQYDDRQAPASLPCCRGWYMTIIALGFGVTYHPGFLFNRRRILTTAAGFLLLQPQINRHAPVSAVYRTCFIAGERSW